ncbi:MULTISPECIES: hypothetical protein [Serratia]|jgi:hypothetical protein|uniref:hypothetical protein n=1 Tax=Serratia TaxID=613 RepID=UPI002178DB21|nr:hypothetical protein [Serratia quinivorans]CAI0822705.1 Uncharacterised protein [Serratia quinivorans]
MLVYRSQYEPSNNYLPVYDITSSEENILRLSPSTWMDSTKGVNSSDGINVTSIDDRTGGFTWLPLKAGYMPRLITSSNGYKIINFGLGRGPSIPGALFADNNYEIFPADGVFSLAMVYRIPLRQQNGYDGSGGNIIGNNDTNPNIFRLRFRDDGYRGSTLYLHHGVTSPITQNNYPINTSFTDDGVWHTLFIEVTTEYHLIEIDGLLKQRRLVSPIKFNTSASRKLIIGGAGNPLSNGFFGDIAMLIVIPRTITSEDKLSINVQMNNTKLAIEQS